MQKVIRDGKVAVAISTSFGAGWTSWNSDISPFEPCIINMIEQGKQNEITEEWCKKNIPNCPDSVYCGGCSDLQIEWIPVGVKFSINEYDGSESIYRVDELQYEA